MTYPNLSDIVKITLRNCGPELAKGLIETNETFKRLYGPSWPPAPLPLWRRIVNTFKYNLGTHFLRWAKALGVDTYE